MLNVLLESKAPRTRRVRGTLLSALAHGVLIAGAIALTVPPIVHATDGPEEVPLIHLPVPLVPDPIIPHRPREIFTATPPAGPRAPTVEFVDPALPKIEVASSDVHTAEIAEAIGPRLPSGAATGDMSGPAMPPGGIVDEHHVERAPRLIGRAEPPTFPSALRAMGKSGRVVIQFVVDTTGRAEMNEFRVVDTNDPQFGDAVRNVLPRYRFSPGEAGGRKVRTLVQMPFDFTLVR